MSATPKQEPPEDFFAYATIEEYEELIGHKVNETFRIGWTMARTMNSHIAELQESVNKPDNSSEP